MIKITAIPQVYKYRVINEIANNPKKGAYSH